MFAALDVGDDIGAFDIGQCLWSENEMHACLSLRREVGDQIGIFRRNRRRWNFGNAILVIRLTSMWNTIVRSADRTNQTGGRAEFRRRHGPITSINHGLPVGFTTMTLRRHLFVERMIKQHKWRRKVMVVKPTGRPW